MHQAQIRTESVLFVLSCFVFCEITASFLITLPFRAVILYFGSKYPRAPALSEIHARGRGGLQPGASRDCRPPWGRPKADRAARTSPRRSAKADRAAGSSPRRSGKADRAAGSSARRSAKADNAARTSSRRSAKADRPARTSPRRSAKADNGGRLRPAWGFSGRAAGRNGALPYNARKSQFLRNGDVWATESLFLFAVLWLAFLPDQSETGVAGGGKARRPETPAAPRRPAQRPRPAPGFCAASANARPGDPAPVRLLEKALWVPPTTEPFRPAPSGKPERKKERRNPG